MAAAPTGRCYVYGVVEGGSVVAAGRVGDLAVPDGGLKGQPVTTVSCGDVAAVVSPLGSDRVRSSRADLSAHERVVEFVAAGTTILPLQFGVVMAEETAVIENFLEPNQADLSRLLAELAGKVELRLKATYLGDEALRDAVAANSSIRRLQERVRSRGEAASYHDRIQLGELVVAGLERIKADEAAAIIDRLGPRAVSTMALRAPRDDVAVHAAFLVDETGRQPFDEAVDALAQELGQRMSFELVGPLAPWDFVDHNLVTGQETPPAASALGRR